MKRAQLLLLAPLLGGACAVSKSPIYREATPSHSIPTTQPSASPAGSSAPLPPTAAVQPAHAGDGAAAPMRERVSIDQTGADNPAGLSRTEVEKLTSGGPSGDLKLLYPYDGTVFPRDMLSPTFMWQGDSATRAVYLRIASQQFEYKTVLRPAVASGGVSGIVETPIQPQLKIAQDIWDKLNATTQGKNDPFQVELSVLVGGVVAGPVVSHFIVAPGAIKGSIYYTM